MKVPPKSSISIGFPIINHPVGGTPISGNLHVFIPRCSMYGIFTYIYPKNGPNVGKYSIHGASGIGFMNQQT